MGKPNEKTAVAVHKIYAAAGGKAVLGNFGLATPEKLGIADSTLVSQDGLHKAQFCSTDKVAQKDTVIKITHGKDRGLSGNLDETAKKLTANPKKSGWLFWMVVDPPAWYLTWLEEKATDTVKAKAKSKAKAKAQGTRAAAMGGLEQ